MYWYFHILLFIFFHDNTGYGYSLEALHSGASSEYQQPKLSWRNKKLHYVDTPSYLKILSKQSEQGLRFIDFIKDSII